MKNSTEAGGGEPKFVQPDPSSKPEAESNREALEAEYNSLESELSQAFEVLREALSGESPLRDSQALERSWQAVSDICTSTAYLAARTEKGKETLSTEAIQRVLAQMQEIRKFLPQVWQAALDAFHQYVPGMTIRDVRNTMRVSELTAPLMRTEHKQRLVQLDFLLSFLHDLENPSRLDSRIRTCEKVLSSRVTSAGG